MGNGFGSRVRKLYTAAHEFITEKGIETHEEAKASRVHSFAHFWLLVVKSFGRNRCPLRATALAYTTLLALIPLLAVSFGIVSSLLKEKGPAATQQLIGQIVDAAVPQLKLVQQEPGKPSARQEAVQRIEELINNANSKTLGVTGTIGLIAVAILLLSTIEGTFNDIWGVTRGRSWLRRLVQYWTMISLGPIALFLLIYLVSTSYSAAIENLPFIGKFVIKALPFVLVSIGFAAIYMMMPNTQVNWRAALMGGIVGGSLWLLLNIFNAAHLNKVINMSKIYGTALGVIPIFLLGLYFSWLIMLFGAQVAYAFQNRDVYLQEKKAESVNQRNREYVALRVMTLLAQRFDAGQRPPTVLEIAAELAIPSRLVGRVLQPLMDANLVLEVSADQNQIAYTPARPTETITCYDVLQTLRAGGGQELETRDEPCRSVVCSQFERIEDAERRAASSVTLKDIVHQIPTVTSGGAEEERRQIKWRPA
ncbi:MAG: YihY family inner membrane protein [Verrucomicrobia subdivision 3 bacterium]|nr:YihY family inner membrane protein [Limisphaerales bacterium]